MKKGFLVIAIALACAVLAACGDDSPATQQPAVTEPAATVVPISTPTAVPTPTDVPTPAPTPTPTVTPAPTATATAPATPTPETGAPAGLPADCLPGGALDNAATVFSCNAQAMQQLEGFSFEGDFDLLALFPFEGAGAGESFIRLSGSTVLPDRLRFKISLGPEGEMIDVNGVVIGNDTYVQDIESDVWFKGTPPEADFLAVLQIVGFLYLPNDANATLEESIDLGDGSRGYVLVSDQTGIEGGMGGPGTGGSLTRIVGVNDFLTREVRVAAEGLDGETRDIITINYVGFNEPLEIEPPAQWFDLPDMPVDSGTMDKLTVVGLARNEAGDIEVTFSEPVFVQGKVELYVLDPQTGGWGLPLLGGSGTDTLTFDGGAVDGQELIVGESQIAGIAFPEADSEIVDSDGNDPILAFEPWTYE